MKIAVNTRLLLKDKLEGIGWFTHELLKRIVLAHPEDQFYFLFDRPYDASFIFAANVTPIVIGPQARHPILFYTWCEWSVASALKKIKPDVYFSPDAYGTLRTKVPTCLAVHDLAFLHYPNFIKKSHLWHYKHYIPKYIQKASSVVAVSEFTKQDIIKQYRTPESKISIIYNGAQSVYRPLTFEEKQHVKENYTDGNEYFIYTGALHPRKNIINMLKAFVQFKRRQRTKMKLVMVGRMAWMSEEIEEAKNKMPFKDEVIWLGYQSPEVLAHLMGAAYALVYPSLFEGFGIPILEAMNCHVPSITSKTSSMPEVGGAAALYCNPESVEEIAANMNFIYTNEAYRSKLVEMCKTEKLRFSWDESAEKLYDILKATASK